MGFTDAITESVFGFGLGDVVDVITGETAKEQAAVQKESNEQARASQIVSQRTQTRQQIRQNRIRRAQLAQAASASGVGVSSGVEGTAATLATDLSTNLAFASGQSNTATNISALNQQAADLQVKQQLVNQFINLAGTAASFATMGGGGGAAAPKA